MRLFPVFIANVVAIQMEQTVFDDISSSELDVTKQEQEAGAEVANVVSEQICAICLET